MTNEELAIKIQAGEQNLIAELWEQNKGLFYLHANKLYIKYRERCDSAGVEFDDIVQTGYFALCDAVQAFQADGEYKFTSYIPFHLLNHFYALLGIKWHKKKWIVRDMLNQASSLDESIGDDDSNITRMDTVEDPESGKAFEAVIDDVFQSELRETFEKLISKLPEYYAATIRGRYFEGKKQGDIAAQMGVSHTAVNAYEREALRKLKKEPELQAYHDEILLRYAYKGTGFASFREHWASSVERAVIEAETRTNQRRENILKALRKGGADDEQKSCNAI